MLATCRHVFILKGLDMKRGEIFQYPYILQKQFPSAQFFAYDVACRYYPWLQKFDGETAKKQTPMLSVMHAKSHQWSCQMKWSGKVVKGAGRSTGETFEQANSYLSRLGPVTRNSHSAARRERITQSAKSWNSRKLLELPVWIAAQLSKMKREIKEMEEQFVVMCGDLKKSEAQIEQLGEEYSKIGEGDITPQERKMEELACRYKILVSSIFSDPDSSKTRKRHRDMLTKVKGQFESEVDKYLSGRKKGMKVSKKELLQVQDTLYFPWMVAALEISPGLLAAVDLHHRINRCYEEVEVLLTERDNLIEYINDKLETGQDKSGLTKELVFKIRLLANSDWPARCR
ncbi:uncharacterized protein [Watersipora subatra]|uniref:uncharacterized protein isoform X1 n=2 Tax=Watersipora subatra TaxID=2589382 RepID=UPI00355B170A